jgi:outer membrane protein
MRATVTALMAAAALALVALPAAAQAPVRIGYVNSERILESAPGAREAEQVFQREMQGFQSELQRMGEELQKMMSDFEQQQVMLSPDARRTRQEAIQQRQRQYMERQQQIEQQAGRRQAELVQPIMKRVNDAIEEVRQAGNYSLILDSASGLLVAADPALDLTDQVLARLRATARP